MRDRLKYLAGSELGAGVFTADTDPDDKAAELRAVQVAVSDDRRRVRALFGGPPRSTPRRRAASI